MERRTRLCRWPCRYVAPVVLRSPKRSRKASLRSRRRGWVFDDGGRGCLHKFLRQGDWLGRFHLFGGSLRGVLCGVLDRFLRGLLALLLAVLLFLLFVLPLLRKLSSSL